MKTILIVFAVFAPIHDIVPALFFCLLFASLRLLGQAGFARRSSAGAYKPSHSNLLSADQRM